MGQHAWGWVYWCWVTGTGCWGWGRRRESTGPWKACKHACRAAHPTRASRLGNTPGCHWWWKRCSTKLFLEARVDRDSAVAQESQHMRVTRGPSRSGGCTGARMSSWALRCTGETALKLERKEVNTARMPTLGKGSCSEERTQAAFVQRPTAREPGQHGAQALSQPHPHDAGSAWCRRHAKVPGSVGCSACTI